MYQADGFHALQVARQGSSGPLVLNLPVKSVTQSILVLTVKADRVKFTVNRSPGSIIDARVSAYTLQGVCKPASIGVYKQPS